MEAKTKKKKSPLAMFIPMKGDKPAEIIRKCIFFVAIIVVAVCAVMIISELSEEARDNKKNEEIRDIKEINAAGSFSIDEKEVEEIRQEVPGILDKYVDLYAENNDLVGWIKIDDTPIDYPVMQVDDNEYYLHRNFYKEDAFAGSIFVDFHDKLTAEHMPNNTILFGHNMNNGSYFGKLTNYLPMRYGSIDFYLTHPTITFDTIYGEGTYKVFAGIFTNVNEKDGYVYNYHHKWKFRNELEFMDFMGNVMDRSTFYTTVDVEYGDQILTLSTCYWPMGEQIDCRFVLFARKVREGESPEVDVSGAYQNESPLYFDTYYKWYGGSWAGRNWDLSLVKDFDKYNDIVDSTKANPDVY